MTCGFEQQSIDALNSYWQLLLDKDIAIRIVLFITILQNKQKVPWRRSLVWNRFIPHESQVSIYHIKV